ncbi:dihydroneopterin aldolase [Spirochaeta africana]|uniref:dihydroneopterin aldolase n=1 Tax=Spirochaeta africana (strain ATCC 700263 / DSM 8902 / Z-7692) TaxID=889378 RepID=H9UIK4_SPIAZ|nr:dihydroneopterin aldolase [Spirochaeta africana]AFG37347.1 FolB domain protein [Spirochaeta africana DSM 8902]
MLAIQIENIRLRCIVGVYPRERYRRQPLRIDLRLLYADTAIIRQDDIAVGMDYAHITRDVQRWASEGRFQTIEALAGSLAHRLGSDYPQIAEVQITIRKPRALSGRAVAGVVYSWQPATD